MHNKIKKSIGITGRKFKNRLKEGISNRKFYKQNHSVIDDHCKAKFKYVN